MWFMREEEIDSHCSSGPSQQGSETEACTPKFIARPLGFIETKKQSARELKNEYLTTGCKIMDQFLKGGVPCFGVTEIYGESACCKTQLCLQLALMAQLPVSEGGLGASAVYISTEGAFPSSRLAELANYFLKKFSKVCNSDPMSSVIVESVLDCEALLHLLRVKLPVLMSRQNIRLIILDSVAAVFRGDYTFEETSERTSDLRQVGAALHSLATTFNSVVVVVNQATTSLSENRIIPALGLVWSNMVTTRLQLTKESNQRTLAVVHANHLAPKSISIKLDASGMSGLG